MLSLRVNAATAVVVISIATLVGAAAMNYVREQHKRSQHATAMTGGNPNKALAVMRQYGCASCHAISGAEMPGGLAGPPLSGIADRLYIAGVIENTPENMVRWIVNPKQFSARTAMPVTGISESEARNVAAFLYRLR